MSEVVRLPKSAIFAPPFQNPEKPTRVHDGQHLSTPGLIPPGEDPISISKSTFCGSTRSNP
jgi:hypothetical protein